MTSKDEGQSVSGRPKSQSRGCGRPKAETGRVWKECADCGYQTRADAGDLVCPVCEGPLTLAPGLGAAEGAAGPEEAS